MHLKWDGHGEQSIAHLWVRKITVSLEWKMGFVLSFVCLKS